MTVRLVFVRHGETEHNIQGKIQGWTDSDLTRHGLEQARMIARDLELPDLIIASDLARCRQTARAIQEALSKSVPLLLDWRVRERYFGALEGTARDNVDWGEFFSHPEKYQAFGVEAEQHFEERVKSFLRDLDLIDVRYAVVVVHGGVLNRLNHLLHPSAFRAREFENAEMLLLEIDPNDPRFAKSDIISDSRLAA